jgi:ligand-binding sensor domain-containing protein
MKRIYNYLLVVFFVLFGCKSNKKNENVVSDLNNYSISSIVVDQSNTKWIGTDNGLYESVDNGYELQDISIPGKILSLYYEKSSNTLWVGTSGGLSKVIINSSEISSITIPSSNFNNTSILTSYIDSSSRRWFGTGAGFSLNYNNIWKKDSFAYSSVLSEIYPMAIEIVGINSISSWGGDYYFATNTYGLYRAANFKDSIDAFTGATQWSSPYNGSAATDTMFVVFLDSKGKIWMGGTNGVQFHTGHDSESNITYFSSELPNIRIHAIAEAPNGIIWIGTEKGIAKYDGNNWTSITTGLPNLFVTAIAFDKNGSAWVGTKNGLVNIN